MSTSVRIGAGCPTGPTPPMAWPVHSRTAWAEARSTTAAPIREATRDVSTRCAPLVITSSGAPSAAKIRLLAIAPTSQPSWAAADAAVGAASGNTRTEPGTPSERSTREKSAAMLVTLSARSTGLPRDELRARELGPRRPQAGGNPPAPFEYAHAIAADHDLGAGMTITHRTRSGWPGSREKAAARTAAVRPAR